MQWSNLAQIAYLRNYSRDDERWHDTIRRAIAGNIRGHNVTAEEISALEHLMLNRKAMPAGRGLWFSGTKAHEKLGGVALCNCWCVAGDQWESLILAQDLLMLGGGVGMSVEHKYVSKLPKVQHAVHTHRPSRDTYFIVPDTREGWNMLIRLVLKSHFVKGNSFDYSTVCIRGKGEPITGFGGVASGPLPLIRCVEKINRILNARAGEHVRPVDMMDLLCCIGEMVVSGNVRRSAIMIMGDPWDREFLTSKRWDLKTVPTERQFANLSVIASDYDDLHPSFWKTYEAGEPFGIVNRKNIRKYGRMGEECQDSGAIGVNPCVTGDTEILTEDGYRTIESCAYQNVIVWNGERWSRVYPHITGVNQPLLTVTLSSGQKVTCTPYHKFITWDGYSQRGSEKRVEAKDLIVGTRLRKFAYPIVHFSRKLPNAYTQGFYQGDGDDSGKRSKSMRVYGNKRTLIPYLHCKEGTSTDAFTRIALLETPLPKGFVPIEYSIASRLDWLSGYADADGTISKEGGIQITSVDRQVLLDTQKMLTLTGCPSKVVSGTKEGKRELPDGKGGTKTYFCRESYRLLIGAEDVQVLRDLGFNPHRLMLHATPPNRSAARFVTVTSIRKAGIADKVYCFNERDAHRGCFNGIVLGNCGEATLEHAEPCNLQEIFLPRLNSVEEFVQAARLMHRWGKRVCLERYHHPEIEAVIKRNMRIGTGITGCLQSNLFNADTLDYVYGHIQSENFSYSRELNVPASVRTTVIKPSGTLSLLGDCTAGIHPAFSEYYIRRVRFSDINPLVQVLRDSGHRVEPQRNIDGSVDYGTLVVDFPVCMSGAPTAANFDTWKQLDAVLMAQRYWSDQSISVTVYYRKSEIPKVKEWVKNHLSEIKTISFLCHDDHGFDQAPLEEITKEQYERMSAKIKPIDWSGSQRDETIEECEKGACPTR